MKNWQTMAMATLVLSIAATPFGCSADDDDDASTPTATNSGTGTATGGGGQGGGSQGGGSQGGGSQGGGGQGGAPTASSVCNQLCPLANACPPQLVAGGAPGGGGPGGGSPKDCMSDCTNGLASCSASELQQALGCGTNLQPPCHLDNFMTCVEQIPCTGSGQGGGSN